MEKVAVGVHKPQYH